MVFSVWPCVCKCAVKVRFPEPARLSGTLVPPQSAMKISISLDRTISFATINYKFKWFSLLVRENGVKRSQFCSQHPFLHMIKFYFFAIKQK